MLQKNNEMTKHLLAEETTQAKARSKKIILQHNIVACNNPLSDKKELKNAIDDSEANLKALNAQSTLQEMLIAQMTSIHLLQQKTIALANRASFIDTQQYFINSSIKLANCFTQQAALLAKLQGTGSQKIIVEHVEVHNGGQAIVGNVRTTPRIQHYENENDPLHRG